MDADSAWACSSDDNVASYSLKHLSQHNVSYTILKNSKQNILHSMPVFLSSHSLRLLIYSAFSVTTGI